MRPQLPAFDMARMVEVLPDDQSPDVAVRRQQKKRRSDC